MPNPATRPLTFALVTTIALLTMTGSALAAERYAAPNGTAAASSGCQQQNPCDILDAIDSGFANLGDEVLLAPGEYNVSEQVYLGAGVHMHGTGKPEQTRIVSTYGGAGSLIVANVFAALSDVQVETSVSNTAALAVPFGQARRVIAINQVYSACSAYSGTISDSICIGGNGTESAGFRLIVSTPADNPSATLRNVTAISRSATGSGLMVLAMNGATASVSAKSVIARGPASDVRSSVVSGGSATVTLDHSNFATRAESGGGSITSPSVNSNQTAAPVFADAANGNYREGKGSPTIDAGAVDGSSGTTDLDGNPRIIGAAADIGAAEFDNVAPAAPTITAPAGGAVLTTAPVLAAGSAEPGSRVAGTLNGAPAGTTTATPGGAWSIPLTLTNGSYTLAVTASDANDNVSTPATVSFTVQIPDVTAPKIKLSKKPKSKTTATKAKFSFSSNEPATFKCKLDKGKTRVCKSPYSVKVKRGRHKLKITATDAAGNRSSATVKWAVVRK